MVRYIRTFEAADWGILTNGRTWRLYTSAVSSAATQFYEVDLIASLEDPATFKQLWLFFRADSYYTDHDGMVFPQRALTGSLTYSRQVGDELKRLVFEQVFPYLAGGFVQHRQRQGEDATSEAARDEIYAVTLSLLYKLLFLLYAEARDLLPIRTPGYQALSLSRAVSDIARMVRENQPLGTVSARLYDNLLNLFDVIDAGDPGLSVPRYNGGLFKRTAPSNQFMRANKIADDKLAQAVYRLAHLDGERIDYAYLDVRELGAIYEGLLEYRLIVDDAAAGSVHLENDKGERRALGAYYTPNHIVHYIVEQTLSPILAERETRYNTAMDALAEGDETAARTAVEALLNIKICDPAMGSGHFLVEAVDYLTDKVIAIIERRKLAKPEEDAAQNPILTLLERIRQGIIDDMAAQGLTADPAALTDTQLLMRVVMKRCIYGVDLNPLAVELAKLSLWLHTFTIGAPLSFLDHHLRRGNSLLGVMAREVIDELGATLFGGPFAELLQATGIMREVSRLADATISDVERSQALYADFETAVAPYKRLLDLWTSQHFDNEEARNFLILYGVDALDVAQGKQKKIDKRYREAFEQAQALRKRLHFFHWDLEFPEIFIDLEQQNWAASPGFDAVIGNPPYDELSQDALGRPIEEKKFIKAQAIYEEASTYRINLYRLFMALGYHMLKTGGANSFIVPMSLLGDRFTYALRKMLIENADFRRIEAFPQKDDPRRRVFPEAKLPTCLYVLVKQPPATAFVLRTHPGGTIEPDSPQFSATMTDIQRFDPENVTLPLISEGEWLLAQRLATADHLQPLGEIATPMSGEIIFNKQTRPYLSENPQHALVLRGGHVQRYELIDDPKQGEPVYLDSERYLADSSEDSKAYHFRQPRVIFQESAALDNWRRIIATYIPEGSFCGHTIEYFADTTLNPLALLAVFNASVAEWRFRIVSATNHLSVYNLNPIPVPKFDLTTPPEARAASVAEAQRLYTAGDDDALYQFTAAQWDAGASAVVHDVLAFLAQQMLDLNERKQAAMRAFLEWLEVFTGLPVDDWTLKTNVRTYVTVGWDEFRRAIEETKGRITAVNVDDEIVTIKRKYDESVGVVLPLVAQVERTDALIDRIVYALYGLSAEEIALVEARIAGTPVNAETDDA